MRGKYRILTQQGDPETVVAFPAAVFTALQQSAMAAGRSFNTELLVRLARTLEIDAKKQEDPLTEDELLEKIFTNH